MQEGQHYQLKAEDKILFNFEDGIGYGFDLRQEIQLNRDLAIVCLQAITPRFQKTRNFPEKKLEDGSIIEIGCYLAPPVEQ